MKAASPQFSANKHEVAAFFEVSLPTVDAWLRKGMPYEQKGGKGKPWIFDLRKVNEWRAATNFTEFKSKWRPEILEKRPDLVNAFRLIAEEAVGSFLYEWFYSDYVSAMRAMLREKGLSKVECADAIRMIAMLLQYWFVDWVCGDVFNKALKRSDCEIDALYNSVARENVSTSPPTDKEAIELQVPEYLLLKPEEFVKEYWPD